jgi:asparagine synthase (glutamine-hydrolysing)
MNETYGIFLLLNNFLSWNNTIFDISPDPKMVNVYKDFSLHGYTDKKIPIIQNQSIVLFFDGFLTNIEHLYEHVKLEINDSPNAIIIELYKLYGFDYTLQLIEGEFALILIDHDLNITDSSIFVARDSLGLKPLYMLSEKNNNEKKIYGFSSSISQLVLEPQIFETEYHITEFTPGSYSEFRYPFKVLSFWRSISSNISYYSYTKPRTLPNYAKTLFTKKTEFTKTVTKLQQNFINLIYDSIDQTLIRVRSTQSSPVAKLPSNLVVEDRRSSDQLLTQTVAEVPVKSTQIACLLSGGMNSSIITGIINEYIYNNRNDKNIELHTYSVGFIDSEDLYYARKVSNYLNTTHHEIIISEAEYIDLIPCLISILETTDKSTIRSGIAMYILADRIQKDGIQYIYSGDGANELLGGYLYCHNAPSIFEFDRECRSLLSNYPSFQGLFTKIMTQFNLVWNRPFLNQSFVQFYHSIPLEFRYQTGQLEICEKYGYKFIEKYLFRIAFSMEYFKNQKYAEIIPIDVLWRTSTLCFDGISSQMRPIYNIIEDKISDLSRMSEGLQLLTHMVNDDIEQECYNYLFVYFFSANVTENSSVTKMISDQIQYHFVSGKINNICQKKWMPKYVEEFGQGAKHPTTNSVGGLRPPEEFGNEPSSRKLPFYFDYLPEHSDRSL